MAHPRKRGTKFITNIYAVKPVQNDHPWDSSKSSLFKGGRYSRVPPTQLVIFLVGRGIVWSLFTSGCCSGVVINTGLPIMMIFIVLCRQLIFVFRKITFTEQGET